MVGAQRIVGVRIRGRRENTDIVSGSTKLMVEVGDVIAYATWTRKVVGADESDFHAYPTARGAPLDLDVAGSASSRRRLIRRPPLGALERGRRWWALPLQRVAEPGEHRSCRPTDATGAD